MIISMCIANFMALSAHPMRDQIVTHEIKRFGNRFDAIYVEIVKQPENMVPCYNMIQFVNKYGKEALENYGVKADKVSVSKCSANACACEGAKLICAKQLNVLK